jgi:hypothetical protein
METKYLQIDKDTAIKLYPNASPELKEIMHQTFGAKTFLTDVCERVKTLDDAYRETGVTRLAYSDPYCQAMHEIEVFAAALREGKEPKDCFYLPYFDRSGGGFSYDDYSFCNIFSTVGARLRVDTAKKARHLGETMLRQYEIMDKG